MQAPHSVYTILLFAMILQQGRKTFQFFSLFSELLILPLVLSIKRAQSLNLSLVVIKGSKGNFD